MLTGAVEGDGGLEGCMLELEGSALELVKMLEEASTDTEIDNDIPIAIELAIVVEEEVLLKYSWRPNSGSRLRKRLIQLSWKTRHCRTNNWRSNSGSRWKWLPVKRMSR